MNHINKMIIIVFWIVKMETIFKIKPVCLHFYGKCGGAVRGCNHDIVAADAVMQTPGVRYSNATI